MVHTLRFRSVDQISTACTIAGVMMYSLKKPNSESANSQEILVDEKEPFWRKWPVAVGNGLIGNYSRCGPACASWLRLSEVRATAS